jgi:hypothetical protein
MRHGRTVVFCLPGTSFSGRFLECWSELLVWCLHSGISPVLSRRQSCNIYYVRNMCLGGDVSRGPAQKPFNSQLDYDYIMWIDSDILFTPQQFERLLSHDTDIVSGIYLMDGATHFATVPRWDEEYFKKHGCFQFLSAQEVADTAAQPSANAGNAKPSTLIEVDYTGMGFMLVRKGVFESMEYPWFRPLEKRIGDMVDFTMEDVAFCLKARERGYTIRVDCMVRVGHEKTAVL